MIPDFRYTDPEKHRACLKYDKCFICGGKLTGQNYIITGPIGLQNRIGSDTPMHEQCARFSLDFCPHMHLKKVDRRPDPDLPLTSVHSPIKAMTVILVQISSSLEIVLHAEQILLNYRPLRRQTFEYVDGILTATTGWERPADFATWKQPRTIALSKFKKRL